MQEEQKAAPKIENSSPPPHTIFPATCRWCCALKVTPWQISNHISVRLVGSEERRRCMQNISLGKAAFPCEQQSECTPIGPVLASTLGPFRSSLSRQALWVDTLLSAAGNLILVGREPLANLLSFPANPQLSLPWQETLTTRFGRLFIAGAE